MPDIHSEIDVLLKRLFPICRSITGDGNRETLRILREIIPLEIIEYPSGQEVFDWTIPDEWNIRDAWIKNAKGQKIIDFKSCNLHVMCYSEFINKTLSFSELKSHLFFNKELPDAVPYRTSYYKKDWAFCLSFSEFQKHFKVNESYEVFIDSEFKKGSLSVGELLLPGKSKKEFLISTYICHPSLANDNLSGVVLAAMLAKELSKKELNFSYRFVFCPETIGAVAYCFNNQEEMKAIDAGFVVTTVGGPGNFACKRSFNKEHYINAIVNKAFADCDISGFDSYPFDPHGSDERQYSSQGFRINTTSICKDKYYEYPYYHTSLDNLDFVSAEEISKTLDVYKNAIKHIEKLAFYKSSKPNCEVMLSKHDMYPAGGGDWRPVFGGMTELDLILWLLFYCDGNMPLIKVAQILKVSEKELTVIALALENKGLLIKL